MAIHKNFPSSPYEILNPDYRWFPADEALRDFVARRKREIVPAHD